MNLFACLLRFTGRVNCYGYIAPKRMNLRLGVAQLTSNSLRSERLRLLVAFSNQIQSNMHIYKAIFVEKKSSRPEKRMQYSKSVCEIRVSEFESIYTLDF